MTTSSAGTCRRYGRPIDGFGAVHTRTPVRALGWARERVGRLLARDACLVRGRLRGPDPGAGARLAGDRARRAHADPGADRLGQDARCLPLRDRPADPGTGPGPAPALRLAAQGTELRHRAQPARAAGRPALGAARRSSHRRHAAERARGDAAQAAGHPDHDPRVAFPSPYFARARDAARGRDGDRGRGPRRRRHQARSAPRPVSGAPATAGRRAGAAERLALRLNELAEEEIARAHHGSLAREQRVEVEELLKRGQIPCLVATSSLELGIDMGAVDLVIQVESPKSVARGLQRVGRAGHELGAVSKGRIFPKYRADLLESAVVVKRMLEGAIEETVIPRNPLDVLAQQIVAIAVDEEISVDDLHELVRGAYPFSDLSRTQLENVLDMLAGRYPSDEFAELRPRIVWDRTGGVIRGRTGGRRLAVTNAGTIPDRGLYGVHLVDGGGRVGELDEEMVYEARADQTFLLGASTWRIEEITRDRVLVSPAPGVPGAVPFWKGEGVGRPYELGEAIGAASRELAALSDEKAIARLKTEHTLDGRAAQNLLTFLAEQQAATGAVPSDRTIVAERFRDEIGDWRLCILTPFGGRVHAPWALALGSRLRESLGLETQAIWSDDGIAIHLPDSDAPPPTEDVLLDPDEVEELVTSELGDTALFGARFRENAGRALLIPRRRPGERTPLWQQRLKAQSLLQVARRYPAFPVVLETYRECLQDVFDLPALKRLLQGLRTRQIDLVDVETPSASPYSASLLFDYVATYMYEDDTPPAERRAQALSLDRELLRELLGQEELRDLIDADAVEEVEAQLLGDPRDPDELHDLLRLRGDLRVGEFDEAHAAVLEAERRALRVRITGDERLIAAEDAGRYRDGLGVMPPSGLPDVYLDGGEQPLRGLVLRYAKGRGPLPTFQANERFGIDVESVLRELEREELLVRGELRPGGTEREG